jgi:hypothetical protein
MKAEWTNKDVLTQSEITGQSKSILVIDTPNNCAECKLMYLQGIGESICNAVDWSRRPSWCPLRPLPKEMEQTEDEDASCFSFRNGWNSYYFEITGETECL